MTAFPDSFRHAPMLAAADTGTALIREAVVQSVTPTGLLLMASGTILGILVGAIPGLTGAMLIALTMPLTFTMSSGDALILLVSMYVGSISGGLITATLLRMPGTPASIMTTLDGYPLARRGKPGRALGLGITASFVGGIVSWGFLILLSKPIADRSTELGPFEFFALVLMALVLIASVAGKSLAKGLLSGVLGMLATMPGVAPATGELRWTMGFHELNDGLKLLPVLIGLFAVSQVITDIVEIDRRVGGVEPPRTGMLMSAADWWRHKWNLLRSSLIGTWIGILPGIGANIGSVMAYTAAKNFSSSPEEFGEGSEEGIVASEAANNATVGGALIPLIALGIPGSVIDAILLGALVIHGLQPGPLLFSSNPDVVYTIMVTFLLANLTMFLFMMTSCRFLAKLVRIPRAYLLPVILVFCVVGSYALANRVFDVWVMLAFGVLGYGLERLSVPLAPFVIGFVLAPVAESNLGKGLVSTAGDWWPVLGLSWPEGESTPVVDSTLTLTFFAVSMAMLIWPMVRRSGKQSLPMSDVSDG